MSESQIQADIFRAIGSRTDCRIFRQNTGVGWAGKLISKLPNGTVVLAHARPLHAGLFVGSADLIGWTIRDGRAIFTSIEVKTPDGAIRPGQIPWRDAIIKAGGIAGIVRSVHEAEALLI